MHFDFTVTIGSVTLAILIVGLIWRVERTLLRVDRLVGKLSVEHEILILDYCKRNNIKLESMPTRIRGLRT
jgi:hypothetical protein